MRIRKLVLFVALGEDGLLALVVPGPSGALEAQQRPGSAMNPSHQPNERQAILLGLAAVLMWSTVATGFKLGLESMSVLQLLLVGTLFSWFVFTISAVTSGDVLSGITGQEIAWGICLGTMNPLVYYWILFAAYDRLPAHIAQPLNYTWAIALAILAIPILQQRLTKTAALGILVSYLGVVVLLEPWSSHTEHLSWFGVFLALASTLIWASYWLLNTRIKASPSKMMCLSFSWALPVLAIACWTLDGWPPLESSTVVYGLWVGLIEMGVTYLIWQQALRKTRNAGRIGQLIFLSPFLSLVIIHFALGESIGWSAVVGLAVIVLGVSITQSESRTARAA